MTRLTIPKPDDWHLHLRDGAVLRAVLPETTRHFARAIVMPNLEPPVLTAADATAYRARIMAVVPQGAEFTPLMTLYLTENTDPTDVITAHSQGVITAVKLYPAGATTNSASGVRDMNKVRHILESMAKHGVPLCIHGEVTGPEIDIFDRELVFLETVLDPLRRELPELRIVLEHVTTREGVEYVAGSAQNLAATITPHHLILNRNHLLAGGIRPHYYCLPVLKRDTHRQALRKAAMSGNKRFFLGTDSAPHIDRAKQSACGCAGVFSASNTLSCLAQVFDDAGALPRLAGFASEHGPAFYRLAVNRETVTLIKGERVDYPPRIATDDGPITLFDPGFDLYWRVET